MTHPTGQHTDERDAYEHIVRQMEGFNETWLWRHSFHPMYCNKPIEFGWQVYQKTLLMMIERANHA